MSATPNDPLARREADNYPTPLWAIDAIVPYVLAHLPTRGGRIFDAGAGDGRILQAFGRAGVTRDRLMGVEIRPDAQGACREAGLNVALGDWLSSTAPKPALGDTEWWAAALKRRGVAAIVMNPPYGGRANLAQVFVRHALERLEPGCRVWALLRLNWLLDGEATAQRTSWLRNGPGLPNVYGLPRRPSFTADGKADATTYGWMEWVAGFPSAVSRFHILDLAGET